MNDNVSLARTQGTALAGSGGTAAPQPPRAAVPPAVDIVEDEGGITLWADMPGVSRERLGVHVDGDSLVIDGEAEVQMPENLQVLHGEIRNPCFRRSFTLSRELDTTKIDATLKAGVLRLHIPKAEEAKPRRIDIKVA